MSPLRTNRYTRSRTIFIGCIIAVVAICLAVYVGFQARFLIEGPLVELTTDLSTVQRERQITITGTARNITAITLNGRPIVTDETGVFRESIILENGYTLVRVEARDRYGRTTYIEQPFVYEPSTLSLAQ